MMRMPIAAAALMVLMVACTDGFCRETDEASRSLIGRWRSVSAYYGEFGGAEFEILIHPDGNVEATSMLEGDAANAVSDSGQISSIEDRGMVRLFGSLRSLARCGSYVVLESPRGSPEALLLKPAVLGTEEQ